LSGPAQALPGFVREFRHQVSPSFGASEISPFSMFATLGTIAELDPAAPSPDSAAPAE
jgi:hypothetical protein